MPRPLRGRATRQGTQASAETDADVPARTISSSDDMYAVTPLKPKAARPDSAEKENEPRRRSLRSRLSSSANKKNNILGDSNRRRAATAKESENEGDGNAPEAEGRRATTGSQRRDTTGLDLDLDDSAAFDIDTSIDDGTASRVGRSATRSANTSSLSISNFKRRSRAPSIIGRDEGSIRPSSRGINTPAMSSTFNIGQFRRRAREPSILGSNRRRQDNATTDQSASEAEGEGEGGDEDEGNFAPDAESTPLTRRKTQAAAASERSESEPELPVARSRKRKSGEVEQDDSDRPEKTARAESPIEIEDDGDDEDSISDESLPSPAPNVTGPGPLPLPTTRRLSTPVNQSDDAIMAPPLSSNSQDSVDWPSIHALAKRRRRGNMTTPNRPDDDNLSDISSPPSLTHSPNFTAKKVGTRMRGRAAKRQASPPKLTTADLAALLPVRRNKHVQRDQFDLSSDPVDTSSLGQDEDELHLDTRRRGTRTRPQAPRPVSRAEPAQSASKSKSAPKNKRISRTYGRSNEASEEGDSFAPLPDDTFDSGTIEVADPKQELKKAARKFKEVDQWELEYETVTGEESQPDAR